MGAGAPLSDIAEDARVDFETEIMPIPQFDPEHPQMISQDRLYASSIKRIRER